MTAPGFRCRACGGLDVVPILSLGDTPLANSLLSESDLTHPQPKWPLDVVRCTGCTLLQITATVPPETLFREYCYFSTYSDTMVQHARNLAERMTKDRQLNASSLVIEIASNDGYLLQHYLARGVPVLGIEPAANIARVAETLRGVRTRCRFFDQSCAQELVAEGAVANIVHAHNVLAHVPDLNSFVAGLRMILAPDGVAVIEAPYLRDLIDGTEFDTIYHEHLSYFSATALEMLLSRHGLTIVSAERIAIHGGSLRLLVARSVPTQLSDGSAARLLQEERDWGVAQQDRYAHFSNRVESIKVELRSLLKNLKAAGYRLAAYGAAAKGSTLLNCIDIGRETLDYVVDRSPEKQGRFTPGARLPIKAPEALLKDMPHYVLLLTWNLADEILQQQEQFRARGGRFIIPIPEIRIV